MRELGYAVANHGTMDVMCERHWWCGGERR